MRTRRSLIAGALAAVMLLALPTAGARADDDGGHGGTGPRVIGGDLADPGEYPFMAAMVDRAEPRAYDGQFCGATVVDRLWVMTAVHCVGEPDYEFDGPFDPDAAIGWVPLPAEFFDVVVGKTDLQAAGGQRVHVKQVLLHPNASFSFEDGVPRFDFALVRLATPIDIAPIQLISPAEAALDDPGVDADVVGWGSVKDPSNKVGPEYPAKLQRATIPMIDDATCESKQTGFGTSYRVDSMICAGAPGNGVPGKGACYGDSGGPLLVRDESGTQWRQAGVVSWGGQSCASTGTGGVYARVTTGQPWVEATIAWGPHGSADRLVRRSFLGFMGHQPAPGQLASWTQRLETGTPVHDLFEALTNSAGADEHIGSIDRLYRAGLGRGVDTTGLAYWTRRLPSGGDLARVARSVVRSAEFDATYGSLDDDDFVAQLYQNVLGRSGDVAGIDFWAERIADGMPRAKVLALFAQTGEFRAKVTKHVHLTIEYAGMIKRVPTAANVTDWLDQPATATGDHLYASTSYATRY